MRKSLIDCFAPLKVKENFIKFCITDIFDGYSFSMTSACHFFHFAPNHFSISTLIDVFKYV